MSCKTWDRFCFFLKQIKIRHLEFIKKCKRLSEYRKVKALLLEKEQELQELRASVGHTKYDYQMSKGSSGKGREKATSRPEYVEDPRNSRAWKQALISARAKNELLFKEAMEKRKLVQKYSFQELWDMPAHMKFGFQAKELIYRYKDPIRKVRVQMEDLEDDMTLPESFSDFY